ncbi:MAG: 6,7-dimethyl-8-ribityllumazine synthase [Rhodothermaceae bacterium]|nr:6,7-dimethyl-8-ribityllumazine synthase [Rhodothermaceae bacterium]
MRIDPVKSEEERDGYVSEDQSTSSGGGTSVISEFKGALVRSKDAQFGIVVSQFNESITRDLLNGCLETLSSYDVTKIDIVWCPGAFELPLAVERMINASRYDAVIALGAVIRGETYHFEAISNAAINGLQEVALRTGVPVALGVITTETLEQARNRSTPGPNHKGKEAALAALEMSDLLQKLPHNRTDAPR